MRACEKNGRAILTVLQVREIRTRYARGDGTQLSLGREYGVSRPTIGLIVRGVTWTHLTGAPISASPGALAKAIRELRAARRAEVAAIERVAEAHGRIGAL